MILAFIGFIIFAIVTIINTDEQSDIDQAKRMELVGKIQFKGKVISSKIYDYGGKSYYFVCVKIDTSNTKNFYIYNSLCGFKIKNGIATMALGVFDSYFGPAIYIEANINNNHLVILHYKKGEPDRYIFTLDPDGLKEKDLNACN